MNDAVAVPYALWLIPSGELRAQLRATVEDLAVRFKSPPFEPHVTLCSGVWTAGLPALRTALDSLCRGFGPVYLTVAGLGQTDDYFSCFFIRLINSDSHRLFERATSAINGARSVPIGPHLSLIYSDRIADINRAGLVQEISPSLPARISFDSAQLVMPATGHWRDVSRWELRHSVSFNADQIDQPGLGQGP